eukprot:jgi/Botrbrau1/9616/Bobra.0131s0001.2
MDPPLFIFATFDPDDLLLQAKASTARYDAGNPLSVLDGVPFAVKDCFDVLPFKTSCGTAYLTETRKVVGDSPCIKSLRESGAMMIGKSCMVEFGLSALGCNVVQGTPRNPYNLSHHCGGSSSGSAAAVACGLCPFALGSDGGGSVRIPSSFCGLVGLKPTFTREGNKNWPEGEYTVTVMGSLAASTGDALLLHSASHWHDMEAGYPFQAPRKLFRGEPSDFAALKGVRVGVLGSWLQASNPEVSEVCRKAISELSDAGIQVDYVEIPEMEMFRAAFIVTMLSESLESHKDAYWNVATRARMNWETRLVLCLATHFSALDYLQAQKCRTRAARYFSKLFQKVDYIISPTVPDLPYCIREPIRSAVVDINQGGSVLAFTFLVNFTGLPAVTIPVGTSSGGLPIGLQIIGRPWNEGGLLYMASVLERRLRDHQRSKPPHVFFRTCEGIRKVDQESPKDC